MLKKLFMLYSDIVLNIWSQWIFYNFYIYFQIGSKFYQHNHGHSCLITVSMKLQNILQNTHNIHLKIF